MRQAFYAGVTEPLVLLAIDPDAARPRRWSRRCPRALIGRSRTSTDALNADAVVRAIPLDDHGEPVGAGESFSAIFFREMFRNVLLATVVLVGAVVGSLIGRAVHDEWGPMVGAIIGLAGGVAAAFALHGRRGR